MSSFNWNIFNHTYTLILYFISKRMYYFICSYHVQYRTNVWDCTLVEPQSIFLSTHITEHHSYLLYVLLVQTISSYFNLSYFDWLNIKICESLVFHMSLLPFLLYYEKLSLHYLIGSSYIFNDMFPIPKCNIKTLRIL